MKSKGKNPLSPEKALEILRKEGVQVSLEQAKSILEFLRNLANAAVSQYLRNRDS